MSYQGKFSSYQKPKKPLWKRILIAVLCVLLLLVAVGAAGAYYYFNFLLDNVTHAEFTPNTDSYDDTPQGYFGDIGEETTEATEPSETTQATEKPEATQATAVTKETAPPVVGYGKTGKIVNILLVGQDSREGEAAKLADSIILATINKETKKLTLTSFLRDTFLKMPDYVSSTGHQYRCGKNRININYALGYSWDGDLGAMKMLNQCLYENFGVEVDGNIEVSFDAFEKLVNEIGGLLIDLTEPEVAYLNDHATKLNLDLHYEPGVNWMEGYGTLTYCRMRKIDSDMSRANRQRKVISQIVDSIRDKSLGEINDLVKLILPLVITDMDKSEITTYIMELLPLLPQLEIVSNQCPAEGTYHGEAVELDGITSYVLVPELTKNREMLMAIAEDN